MAKNMTWANAKRQAMAAAIKAGFNSGYLRIYSGTQPVGPDTALSGQTKLAELRFNATAVAADTNGVMTFNAITDDAAADATGTAAWFRALESDGVTPICDGTVGTADANLVLGTVSITANAVVSVTSCVITVAASSAQ